MKVALLVSSGALLTAGALAGCSSSRAAEADHASAGAVAVRVQPAQVTTAPRASATSGIVDANTTVDVAFQVPGKVAVVGFHQGASREVPMAHWNWMAFTIVNGHFRELSSIMRGMTVGMRLLESGVLSMEGMVSHRFPLEEINEAFRALEEKPPGFVKAVVTFPVG